MARMGMDVDQVAAAGNALKQRAADIDALVSKIDGIVRSMPGVWDGPDAQQFMNEWWPEHKKTLVAASSHVAGLGQSALNNASEQRQVSGTTGGGTTQTANGVPTVPIDRPTVSPALPSSGPAGPQNYKVTDAIAIARSEVGSHGGQCVIAVEHWINAAGGHFGGGGAVSGYTNSGAIQIAASDVRPGDVLQYTSIAEPDAWDAGPDGRSGVHTVMVTDVHSDGSMGIVQSNSTWVNGQRLPPETISEDPAWKPAPPPGFEVRYWRFGQQ